MTDKELLELAAKAASIPLDYWNDGSEPYSSGEGFILPSNAIWNPLTDDGDALRLAVKLGMDLEVRLKRMEPHTVVWLDDGGCVEEGHVDDAARATRRVLVRAAAVIGKAMP